MSWSASISNVAAREAVAKLRENFIATHPEPTTEMAEQFEAAAKGVEHALPAVQPDPDGIVGVSAYGHANPGHAKTEGWANDCVSFSIYQL